MPAYDFRCEACDEVFEVNRSIADDCAVACPTCGGETRKIFSPVGVVFKGSGFHNTDYKQRPAENKDAGAGEAAPCGASKSDGGACATCPAAKEG